MSTTRKEPAIVRSQTGGGSSNSVRVFWLNCAETVRRLRQAARMMSREHSEIERVILFGSLARADAGPGSDADLLLILRECEVPWLDRSIQYRPEDIGIDVDVFAYTRSELKALRASGGTFVKRALREGFDLV